MSKRMNKAEERRTFMGRLAGDARGNTLAIMAAALIPITALTGSAVDTARMYVVKVRLQQACDAGVLAGRKFMVSSNATTLDSNAATQAKTFFANNYSSGFLGTPTFTSTTSPYPFTPSKTADNQVAGTATVQVPMTLMKMFGAAAQPITVTCQARYDVADTDVMFVLDNTGSMACGPSDPDSCGQPVVTYTRPDGTTDWQVQEKSNSRISALRSAVLSFYDTVASTADSSTHFRYGFVPYTSTVNVGGAITSLSPSYMLTNWNYDTRHVVGDHNQGNPTAQGPYTGFSQSACLAYNNQRVPATGYNTDGTAIIYQNVTWSPANNGTCKGNGQTVTPIWRYENYAVDVSQYMQTLGTSNTVVDPSKVTGATSKWQGCIEERDPTTATMTFNQNSLPADLDPDLAVTSNATKWRPMWPAILYDRNGNTTIDDYGNSTNPYGDSSTYWNFPAHYGTSNYSPCPKPAQRLTTMSRTDVSNYLNASDFVPWGGTYHDTGMVWGVRMLSPSGPFATDTAAWPGRQQPNRYIVFMTDGHMSTTPAIDGLWGWENYDKRVTGGDFSNSDAYHNARLLAECTAAKNRNIKVYVVSVATAPDANLTSCASPNSTYFASDSASLTAAFQAIAKQVAMLRISQ